MARFRHLPIWKTALELAVHLEQAVRRFPRYHKYTLGSERRQTAQRICRLVARVNEARALRGHCRALLTADPADRPFAHRFQAPRHRVDLAPDPQHPLLAPSSHPGDHHES